MSKTGTASSISEGQKFEFSGALMRQLPRILEGASPARIQSFINNQDALVLILREAILGVRIDYLALLSDWQKFYAEVFGLTKDFTNLVIPEKPEGFDQLLVIANGITPEGLFAKCKERFSSWKYVADLNIVTSVCRADKDYAIWVRYRVEADEETKNFSANEIQERGIQGITLPERLVYELFFHWKTGRHLDFVTWTLCAGSRGKDGDVPRVGWSDANGTLSVGWCGPDSGSGILRARVVVFA